VQNRARREAREAQGVQTAMLRSGKSILLAGVFCSLAVTSCRKHSWEENPGVVPPALAELGAELDASGVQPRAPKSVPAEASVGLFFRKSHYAVAKAYVEHFEAKGYRHVDCGRRASTSDTTRLSECFANGRTSVYVKANQRIFPLFGTELERPMAEVEVYLNPEHLKTATR
jgi:hypothetical protein